MSKSNTHDDYDFGNDPEFQENFIKNIDRVLSDIDFDSENDIHEDKPTKDNKEAVENHLTALIDDSNISSEAVATEEEVEATNNEMATDEAEIIDTVKTSDEADTLDTVKATDEADSLDTVKATDEDDSLDIATAIAEGVPTESINADDEIKDSANELAAAASQMDTAEIFDETLFDINNSLARQIDEELENLEAGVLKNKKRARMLKIQISVVIGLLSLLGIAFFLGFTKSGNQLLMKMGINIVGWIWDTGTQDFSDEPNLIEDVDHLDEEDIMSDSEEIDPNEIVWPNNTGYGRREEGVYNILLLGEEAIDSGTARGRTDLIIIATLNKKSKKIKLTSIMRDTLVQIPGYRENKINSAYEKGDVKLLYETIALNFNIHLDGAILVNFEKFEKIIDYLGGIELTLTKSEAKYLRNTNYISNPAYRTVVEGTQHMNGNQVLGYSRIRKRAAITGNNNDYGRTDRHRIILNAIFEKYKSKNEIELGALMIKMIPMVRTDIDSKTFEKLLNTFIEMGTMEIDQLRLPADGTFTDNVKVREMDVLIPDLAKNISILHEFVFED